jgi:hypothetical protein
VAAAAWWQWEAQWKLGGSNGCNGCSADATAAALPLRALVVATKTPAKTGLQITINNQQKQQWQR